MTDAKDATTAFADKTRGKGGKHDLGEPHVHMWAAVVGVCVNKIEGPNREILQSHITDANREGPKALLPLVRYARLKKTFDRKYMRMYFAVHASIENVLQIIISDMVKGGAQEKHGSAPRSALERDIQSKLDGMSGEGRTQQ